jgi:hypothetical protein
VTKKEQQQERPLGQGTHPYSTEEQRALQKLAQELERARAAKVNESERPGDMASGKAGDYFVTSNGIPVDANGEVIPEAEWKPEHAADVRARYPDTPIGKLPLYRPGGADIHPTDGGVRPGTASFQGVQAWPGA